MEVYFGPDDVDPRIRQEMMDLLGMVDEFPATPGSRPTVPPVDPEVSAAAVIQPPTRRSRGPIMGAGMTSTPLQATQEQCRQAYLALVKVPVARVERPLADLITGLRTTLAGVVTRIENGESFAPPRGHSANNEDEDEDEDDSPSDRPDYGRSLP
jgi:hypothetical protein